MPPQSPVLRRSGCGGRSLLRTDLSDFRRATIVIRRRGDHFLSTLSGSGHLSTNSNDFSMRISPVISPMDVREMYS